ncbi:MAG: hypothetical protein A3C35_07420 [Omnitrophica bacterium RIFCSPHIGHO2_02_FULL_46_11]|nr:MAG: hypothetical protein A3C35_07420 [Omnitrophica bacterium RIFCSPHIGHO2_02_FULL_46_11]OGW87388.1 MAG: hypothetical protein A3A81_04475 [Omnitrophica bacterium RIFCSPLOWO2_01_FULL_45_10b]
MQAKEKKTRRRRRKTDAWFLYILRCKDGSLYTGITKDLERRFKMHTTGKASHYTRTRRPLEMLYREPCGTRTQALVRECFVKSFSKKKKEKLILGQPCL